MEQAIGGKVPEYEGEFTDWWANGAASGPREVAASRVAKRLLAAAQSPLWGPMPASGASKAALALQGPVPVRRAHVGIELERGAAVESRHAGAIRRESNARVASDGPGRVAALAARSLAAAAARARGCSSPTRRAGPTRGWVRMPATCLRDDYRSLLDPSSGARLPLRFENGIRSWTAPKNPGELTRENTAATFPDNVPNQTAKFWIDNLAAESVLKLRLETQEARRASGVGDATVEHDEQGWPVSAQWPGMNQPLFVAGTGVFRAGHRREKNLRSHLAHD